MGLFDNLKNKVNDITNAVSNAAVSNGVDKAA